VRGGLPPALSTEEDRSRPQPERDQGRAVTVLRTPRREGHPWVGVASAGPSASREPASPTHRPAVDDGRPRRPPDGTGLGYLVLLVIAIALIAAFWQFLVLIAVGGLGIGLVWWARNRGRSTMTGTADPQAMLTELGDLHAAGVLTDAEFQAKKATILRSAQPDSSDLASPGPERN
jgi:hypothetical protein